MKTLLTPLFLCLCLAGAAGASDASEPSILLTLAQKECAAHPDQESCKNGYAVIKDRAGAFQYLLIPTDPVTGIESPALLDPRAGKYWSGAWRARSRLDALAGPILPPDMHGRIPREDVALAVNSPFARSQDQLHIHIDCVDGDVQKALRAVADTFEPGKWLSLSGALKSHWYQATRLSEAELGQTNLFRLVADLRPDDPGLMGATTIVVVGAPGDDAANLYDLVDRVDPTNRDAANGEELMDHGCSVLGIGQ